MNTTVHDPRNVKHINKSLAKAMRDAQRQFKAGRMSQAKRCLREALELSPDFPPALLAMSDIAGRLGEKDSAQFAARAVELNPGDLSFALEAAKACLGPQADASANDGEAARTAAALLETALALAGAQAHPEAAEATATLGFALQHGGDLDAAIAAYRRALALRPDVAQLHFNLGTALKAQHRFDDATVAIRAAVELAPDDAGMVSAYGTLLHEMTHYAESIVPLRRATELMPDDPEHWLRLSLAYRKLGQPAEAVRAAAHVAERSPRSASAWTTLSSAQLAAGSAGEALASIERTLALEPDNRNALADYGFALAATGATDEAHDLLDLDRLLWSTTIECPAGFDSLEAFNAALVAHVRDHHVIRFDGLASSCHRGSTSDELLVEPLGPVAQLRDAIEAAAARFRTTLNPASEHPWEGALPEPLFLSSWMTRLQTQGHQYSHNHPTAHISGVYYVQLPPAVATDAPEGWIEFGHPPEAYPYETQGDRKLVEPHPGLLLLFPSYVFHRTIPFGGDHERVTIAFDFRTKANHALV